MAQGTWSIDYIPIDSLNSSFLGKEVRLDFKSSVSDTLYREYSVFGKLNTRHLLLSKKDTISIDISEERLLFKENWVIYADGASLDDQTIEYVGKQRKYKKAYIKEMFITSMNQASIVLECRFYTFNKNSKAKKYNITIDKLLVKGIVIGK
jgi:hypothetical protein